ncbi:lysophospholipid acyltransferase family protein [candidate division WOR-3 bacterium]|nr:lysophospholipid acyltransferase family protein [candidate division WOR-3 bacterium]
MKIKDKLFLGPGVYIGYLFILLWGKTLSIVKRNIEETLSDKSNYPAVYLLWHRDLLVPAFFFRNKGYKVLIGKHRDAEYISRISLKLGYRTLRGSATRGSASAMRNIVKSLKKNEIVVITPDGPTGPPQEIKEGSLLAAVKIGAPVIPVVLSYKKFYSFKSWDKFRLAIPFSKVCILFGKPVLMKDCGSRDNVRRIKPILEKKIIGLEKVAEKALCSA